MANLNNEIWRSVTKHATEAYWNARTPQDEAAAYEYMRALGFPAAYGEPDSLLDRLRGHGRTAFGRTYKWRSGQLFYRENYDTWTRAFPWSLRHRLKYWRFYVR